MWQSVKGEQTGKCPSSKAYPSEECWRKWVWAWECFLRHFLLAGGEDLSERSKKLKEKHRA